jgi:hypothetical protein
MDSLTIAQLTTVAGIGIATTLLSEVVWRTSAASDATVKRFGPLLAMGLGLVIATGAGLVLGQGRLDLAQDAINGIVGGLASMGLYDLATSKAGVSG